MNDDLIISVCDSGNGIPKENIKKIFQPFFTTSKVGHGTGIGLSISKTLALANNGDLNYDETASNTKFDLILHKFNFRE